MRFPFFKRVIDVEVKASIQPEKTQYGLTTGKPIDKNTFKILEDAHNQFYEDRIKVNKEVLENKKKVAIIWKDYINESIKHIPTNYISPITIEEDPRNNFENVCHPRVLLKFTVDYGEGDSKYAKEYNVYAHEHEDSEKAIMVILDDIRQIKKKINSLNKNQ